MLGGCTGWVGARGGRNGGKGGRLCGWGRAGMCVKGRKGDGEIGRGRSGVAGARAGVTRSWTFSTACQDCLMHVGAEYEDRRFGAGEADFL